jgi:outer membrane protein assembly factor BamB
MNDSPLHRALALTAWIAGLFCLLVCAILVYEHFAAATNDPWKSPQLLALKEKLAAEPKNELLQQQIRQLDLNFRQKFRRRLALDRTGAWLLLGGGLVLALAAAKAAALKKPLPLPQPQRDAGQQAVRLASRARWSLAGVGLMVAGSLLFIRLGNTSVLPANPAAWQKLSGQAGVQEALVEDVPALSEFQTNWPRFRGWDGSGVFTPGGGAPAWDPTTVPAILWNSAIPAPGHSSPIVWADRVFISGGTAARREVFCYNTSSGSLLWQRAIENVPGSPPKIPDVPEDTGWAAPTMATDGRRVYAIFANGDLGALNFDGSVAWTKYLGPLKNPYGYAASLAVWGNNLLIQLDQGDARAAGSKLISLQGATGRLLWERSRPVPASWATPIVIEAAGQTQIITLANPWVIAYTLAGGNELWRAQLLENEVVPSPVFAGGLVFLLSPGARLMALRPDGAGDVTKTRVVWTNEENVPDIASPASNGELVFTLTSAGMATCFEANDGKKIWEKDLDLEVQASPAIMGGCLFVLGEHGALVMLQAGREFHETGRTQLPDKFVASPAFANGRLFLRGVTNLYGLGPAGAKLARQL